MRFVRRAPAAARPQLLDRARAGLPTAVVPLLVAVAVLGYVAGHSGGKDESSEERARTARTANVLVEYPSGWRPAPGRSPIPGLALAHAQLIAPRGDAAAAGLLVGSLPAREPGPLPASFLERVRRQPQTTIVDLVELQAYRYAQLSVRGFERALIIFVIPNPGGSSTALACYASPPASSTPAGSSTPVGSTTTPAGSGFMRACEQTVASVTIAGQPQTYQLTPEPAYASAISAAIAALDRLRVALKRELRPQVSAADAEALARRLADGYAAAGAKLSRLEPSFASQRAQSTLSAAIEQARAGYAALAAAAGARSASGYAAAQARIAAAEVAVDRALENFVLLGYSPALSTATNPRS